MSGLTRRRREIKPSGVHTATAAEIAPIDPTLELTQPGGPYSYGHSLLTDGMGGYVIETTLRSNMLGMTLNTPVGKLSSTWCDYQGVDTSKCGLVAMSEMTLIGLSVSTDKETLKSSEYLCEILIKNGKTFSRLAVLPLGGGNRKNFRRDLSVNIPAGSELSAKITQIKGSRKSKFTTAVFLIETEI